MAFVSKEDKQKLAPGIKAVLKKYGVKGTIKVQHHMTLVVTLASGEVEFDNASYRDINTYWVDTNYTGKTRDFLNELVEAMKGPDFFDHSDSMTDYFHRSHYIDIKLGRDRQRPYVCTAKELQAD